MAVGSGRALSLTIEFTITIYLMRALNPELFGLIAMATSILVGFAVLKDAGAGASLVSDAKITDERVGAATLISLEFGLGAALIALAATPIVVRFYGEPRLEIIWIVSCLPLLMAPMSSIPISMLQRGQRFWLMSWLPLVAILIAAITAYTVVQYRNDFWPILAFQAIGGILGPIVLWLVVHPGMRWPSRQDMRHVFRFGRGMIGFDVLNVLNRNADNVIIGYFLGSYVLGLYLLAYKVLMIPLREIGGVVGRLAYPRLSSLAPDWHAVGRGLSEVMRDVAMFATPLCLGIAIAAPELITVVFGGNWMGGLVPLRVLALLGIVQAPFAQIGLAYTVSRQTGEMARWGMLSTPVIVLSFFAGIPWGIGGVAVSYSLTWIALLIPMLRIGARVLCVSPWLLARGGCIGISIGVLATLPVFLVYWFGHIAGFSPRTLLATTIAAGALAELALYIQSIRLRQRKAAAW